MDAKARVALETVAVRRTLAVAICLVAAVGLAVAASGDDPSAAPAPGAQLAIARSLAGEPPATATNGSDASPHAGEPASIDDVVLGADGPLDPADDVRPAVADPASGSWRARPATYGVHVTKDVAITVRDGTELFANVFRPAEPTSGGPAAGRFPVVLVQTPYNKDLSFGTYGDPAYLVSRGYVVVIADVRGAGSSGGTFDAVDPAQHSDGYDLVEWAAAPERPWSNGAVGTSGCSYLGVTQLVTAAQQPPHLRASFVQDSPGDIYRATNLAGQPNLVPILLPVIGAQSLVPPGYTASDPFLAGQTLVSHTTFPANVVAAYLPYLLAGEGSRAYDGPYYRSRSPLWMMDRIRVPTFLVGGWYDLFPRDTTLMFQALQSQGTPTRLVMGPWAHCAKTTALPADGLPTIRELELRWFDHYLAGRVDDGLSAEVPPVSYYVPGDGHFRPAPTWPPPESSLQLLHLEQPSSPSSTGRLQDAVASNDPTADSMVWQPAAGPCLVTGIAETPCRQDERVNNVGALSYDLPLRSDLTVAGYVAARLFVSTSGSDAGLVVRLQDVGPDGTVRNVTNGWAALSFRQLDGRTRRVGDLTVLPVHAYTEDSVREVERDRVYELHVDLWNTAHRFRVGHVLRLTIIPSDLSGIPTGEAAEATGVVRVHHDVSHPSSLVFSTVPNP